jgi:hypothetical protein
MKRINAIDKDPKRRKRLNASPYVNGKVFGWTLDEMGQFSHLLLGNSRLGLTTIIKTRLGCRFRLNEVAERFLERIGILASPVEEERLLELFRSDRVRHFALPA